MWRGRVAIANRLALVVLSTLLVVAGLLPGCGSGTPTVTLAPPTARPSATVVASSLPSLTPAPTPTFTVYVVKPKDTLGAIAKSFGCTVDALAFANGISNTNLIVVGQSLIIPLVGAVRSVGGEAQLSSTSPLVTSPLPSVPPTATPRLATSVPPTATRLPATSVPRVVAQTPTPQPRRCAGATALCRDGTCSYSKTRQGTCSHHGGVAVWYP